VLPRQTHNPPAARWRLPTPWWLDGISLRGAKPASQPVERPATFDLAVSPRVKQAIGLTISRRSR